MRVRVCLEAILIPEYLDFHSGNSAPRNRIAGIYSGIVLLFRNIPNERALRYTIGFKKTRHFFNQSDILGLDIRYVQINLVKLFYINVRDNSPS